MSLNRLLIGMTGTAGSGKDTAAAALIKTHGFMRDAFADDMKKAALDLNPLIPIENDAWIGTGVDHWRLSSLVEKIGWDAAKKNPEVRRFLQVLGTEAGWKLHGEDIWIKRVADRVTARPDTDIVITDVRFAAEADWIRDAGGVIVKVVRPDAPGTAISTENARHDSEQQLAGIVPDIVLVNDASIGRLHQNVDRSITLLRSLNSLSELTELVTF